MPEPSYGVVLLNWNGFADTRAALDSLIAADPAPSHIVVVDNGSYDDSLAQLASWTAANAPAATPLVTILPQAENRGYATGNNVGLQWLATSTDVTHFLLLNNDAMVASDYFARMNDALRAFPDAALLGCVIYHHPERNRVWFAGGYEVPYRALVLHHYELPVSHEPQLTPFVTGCAMVISRTLYDSRGGLSEAYSPIYWEDAEYSFRARMNGWEVMLVPEAHVFHRVNASVGSADTTPQVAFWQNRHRAYYVRRNYRGIDRLAAIAYLVATKPVRSVVELLRGRPAMGSAIFRGFLHGLTDDA